MSVSRSRRRLLSVGSLAIAAAAAQGLSGGVSASAAAAVHAQGAALTTLGAEVIPHLSAYRDLGPAPADEVLQVAVTMQHDQAAVNRALAALYDPSSPSYHRWMSPAQFQAQYDAPAHDVAVVRRFATAHGMELYNPQGPR